MQVISCAMIGVEAVHAKYESSSLASNSVMFLTLVSFFLGTSSEHWQWQCDLHLISQCSDRSSLR